MEPNLLNYLSCYQRDLALRGYTRPTQKAYFNSVREFIAYSKKPIDALRNDDVKNFLYELIKKNLSESTLKQALTSIRYFFEQTLNRPVIIENLPKFRKKKTLPLFFSEDEIIKIIQNATNKKWHHFFLL